MKDEREFSSGAESEPAICQIKVGNKIENEQVAETTALRSVRGILKPEEETAVQKQRLPSAFQLFLSVFAI